MCRVGFGLLAPVDGGVTRGLMEEAGWAKVDESWSRGAQEPSG